MAARAFIPHVYRRMLSSSPLPLRVLCAGMCGVVLSAAGMPLRALSSTNNMPTHTQAAATGAAASTASPAASASSEASSVSVPPLPRSYASLDDLRQRVDIVLYQYRTCPFCNKVCTMIRACRVAVMLSCCHRLTWHCLYVVSFACCAVCVRCLSCAWLYVCVTQVRAYLDAMQLPYRTVEVNPLFKSELKAVTDYRKVPYVEIDGVPLKDSDAIIDALEGILNGYRMDKEKHVSSKHEQEGRQFANTRILGYVTPNLYVDLAHSLSAMHYIKDSANMPRWQQWAAIYVGGPMMYMVAQNSKKKRNINNPQQEFFGVSKEW